jgi:hypothetical protein
MLDPPRNFRGAERPSFQLSLKKGGPRRHMCLPVPASASRDSSSITH